MKHRRADESGLPYWAIPERSPARMESTTEKGRPLSFFFRFCSCGPSPVQRPGPAPYMRKRSAHAIVGRRRIGEHAFEFVDRGARSGAAQLEQLAHVIVGLAGQDLRDRALVQRRRVVAARVDGRKEALGLVDRRDRAVRQFLQLQIDGDAFAHGEVLGAVGKGTIETNAAPVNGRVLDLVMALGARRDASASAIATPRAW